MDLISTVSMKLFGNDTVSHSENLSKLKRARKAHYFRFLERLFL